MKLSPMDIQRQTFGRRFRGFDRDEVRDLPRRGGRGDGGAAAGEGRDRAAAAAPRADRERAPRARGDPQEHAAHRAEGRRGHPRERAQGGGDDRQAGRAAGRPPARAGPEPRPRGRARHPRAARRTARRCAPTSARSITRLTHLLDLQEEAEVEDNLRFLKRREEAAGSRPRHGRSTCATRRAGITLRVRVQPRASRDALGGEREGALVVRLTAPPVEGAANEALARFLGRTLGVAPSAVRVVSGTAGRDKLVAIAGLDAATARGSASPRDRRRPRRPPDRAARDARGSRAADGRGDARPRPAARRRARGRGRADRLGRRRPRLRRVGRPPPRGATTLDAGGGAVVPGFVDAHTHLAFAGDRDDEIRRRLAGASYEEIAAGGRRDRAHRRGDARGVGRGAGRRSSRRGSTRCCSAARPPPR